jgi:ubiquinone/menaquinone biosynthesis C-methylase UbiE
MSGFVFVQPDTPAGIAARQENRSSAAYRYRVAIAGLLRLEPGMAVAEVGAVSGFEARALAAQLGPTGKIVASTLDPKMVVYLGQRAESEGLKNFSVVLGSAGDTGLAPASIDAVVVVNAFSTFTRQADMLRSIAASLKPGGALLIVDLPREGLGVSQAGIDADDLVTLATAAGFKREAESSVVPGQYAIRFRRP